MFIDILGRKANLASLVQETATQVAKSNFVFAAQKVITPANKVELCNEAIKKLMGEIVNTRKVLADALKSGNPQFVERLQARLAKQENLLDKLNIERQKNEVLAKLSGQFKELRQMASQSIRNSQSMLAEEFADRAQKILEFMNKNLK